MDWNGGMEYNDHAHTLRNDDLYRLHLSSITVETVAGNWQSICMKTVKTVYPVCACYRTVQWIKTPIDQEEARGLQEQVEVQSPE